MFSAGIRAVINFSESLTINPLLVLTCPARTALISPGFLTTSSSDIEYAIILVSASKACPDLPRSSWEPYRYGSSFLFSGAEEQEKNSIDKNAARPIFLAILSSSFSFGNF
ncbi:MAG: hypothetical protein LBK27_00250 [Treponema sp.]|nr:hypothetical protein [Treponema sp.]